MTLSYAELWFLELAVIGNIPFDLLPESANEQANAFSPQWNMPTHGLSIQEIGETLWLLYASQDIHFYLYKGLDDDPQEFEPASALQLVSLISEERRIRNEFRRWRAANPHQEIEDAPSPSWWDNFHTYSLTPQGIARWEEYAVPDWSRYRGEFDGRLESPGETVWSATAQTVDFAKEMLTVESIDPFHPARIHWEALQIETLQPWEPIPGKRLAAGVRLMVQVTEFDGDELQRDDFERFEQLHQEHWKRFCEICRPWYQHGVANHPDRPHPAK